jgi:hypothetical protein
MQKRKKNMLFVPTPTLLTNETLEPGVVLLINDRSDPWPEALLHRCQEHGGVFGTVLFEGQKDTCMRFPKTRPAGAIPDDRMCVEMVVDMFEQERGESLCSLREDFSTQESKKIGSDIACWYIQQLRVREAVLTEMITPLRRSALTYEETKQQERALYRAANRHEEVTFWQRFGERERSQLLWDWQQERAREYLFAEQERARSMQESGLTVGTLVETTMTPRGGRTVPLLRGSRGRVIGSEGPYWWVEFALPLTDADGHTWEPFDEKVTLTVGYLTEELTIVREGDGSCQQV